MTREEAINYFKGSFAIGQDDCSRHHNEVLEFTIKALEQEPCEDAISRQSMLDYLKYLHGEMQEEEFIKELPSVTPARKKGKWIDKEKIMFPICSKCGLTSVEKYSFCPHCGAKMDE